MKYYLVVYLAGHLAASLGPMESPSICEAALAGFNEVAKPSDIHPYCDLRSKEPEAGEVEDAD